MPLPKMMPDDLRQAYETFTLLAIKHNIVFAGMAMSNDMPAMWAIGNVTEKGHDFAALLRRYADIMDEKTDAGKVQDNSPVLDKSKAN
jgi:hypothetical protein